MVSMVSTVWCAKNVVIVNVWCSFCVHFHQLFSLGTLSLAFPVCLHSWAVMTPTHLSCWVKCTATKLPGAVICLSPVGVGEFVYTIT